MSAPEPTSERFDYRYDFPSDEGLQSKFLYCIVEIPEMGAAGHLGILEERCDGPHEWTGDLAWLGEIGSPFLCTTCKAVL